MPTLLRPGKVALRFHVTTASSRQPAHIAEGPLSSLRGFVCMLQLEQFQMDPCSWPWMPAKLVRHSGHMATHVIKVLRAPCMLPSNLPATSCCTGAQGADRQLPDAAGGRPGHSHLRHHRGNSPPVQPGPGCAAARGVQPGQPDPGRPGLCRGPCVQQVSPVGLWMNLDLDWEPKFPSSCATTCLL